jgi:hypothetical protein
MRLVNEWRRIERGGGSVAFELSAASLPYPSDAAFFPSPATEGREPPSIVRQQQQRIGRLDASIIFCRVLICMSMSAPPLLASPDDDATGGKTPMRKRKTQPFPLPTSTHNNTHTISTHAETTPKRKKIKIKEL